MKLTMTNPKDMNQLPDFECTDCKSPATMQGEHGINSYGYYGTYSCINCGTREMIVVKKNDHGDLWTIVSQDTVV